MKKIKARLLDDLLNDRLEKYSKEYEFKYEQEFDQHAFVEGWHQCAELVRKIAKQEYLRGKIFGINNILGKLEDMTIDLQQHNSEEVKEFTKLKKELNKDLDGLDWEEKL